MSTEWWRVEGWPSAEEWQAFWSLMAVLVATLGLAFAGLQLRESAIATRRAAAAEEAQSRPYVNVRFDLSVGASADPSKDDTGVGLIYVLVESVGRTPAVDVALTVSPAFQSSGRGRPDGLSDPVLDTLNWAFSGDTVISMIGPGETLRYFLDFAENAMSPLSGLPSQYSVTATYTDGERGKRYSSKFVLDFAPWRGSIMSARPVDVIARQLRRLNQNLEDRRGFQDFNF